MQRKKKMVRTNIYLTKIQHDFLTKKAYKKGITFSELLRQKIDCIIEKEDRVNINGATKTLGKR